MTSSRDQKKKEQAHNAGFLDSCTIKIESKIRKINNAMIDRKFNKDSILKPTVLAAEGFTNIPFHEFYEMVEDGVHLSNKNLEDWQKVAIALGYPEWQVNYDPKEEKNKPKVTYSKY